MREEQIVRQIAARKKGKPGPRQFWGQTTNRQPISAALNSGSDSLMFKIG
jgi:hypothetical protein